MTDETSTDDEIPTLELRADEVEAVSIARKGAFLYRARHGAAGEARALELDEFAEAAFEWQHSGGSAPPPVLPEGFVDSRLLERRVEEIFAGARRELEEDLEPSSLIEWVESMRRRILGEDEPVTLDEDDVAKLSIGPRL